MPVPHSSVAESFSITGGGMLRHLLVRVAGIKPERERVIHRAIIASAIT